MLTEAQRQFLAANHNGALTTFRRNGAGQMSIVTCGLYGDGVAFTTTADRAKLRNLRRDPRCTILVGTGDWRNFVVNVLVAEGEPIDRARCIASQISVEGLRDVVRDAMVVDTGEGFGKAQDEVASALVACYLNEPSTSVS